MDESLQEMFGHRINLGIKAFESDTGYLLEMMEDAERLSKFSDSTGEWHRGRPGKNAPFADRPDLFSMCGHPRSGANLQVYGDGKQRCKTCKHRNERAYRERRKYREEARRECSK